MVEPLQKGKLNSNLILSTSVKNNTSTRNSGTALRREALNVCRTSENLVVAIKATNDGEVKPVPRLWFTYLLTGTLLSSRLYMGSVHSNRTTNLMCTLVMFLHHCHQIFIHHQMMLPEKDQAFPTCAHLQIMPIIRCPCTLATFARPSAKSTVRNAYAHCEGCWEHHNVGAPVYSIPYYKGKNVRLYSRQA